MKPFNYFSSLLPSSWKDSRRDYINSSLPTAYKKMVLHMEEEIKFKWNILAALFSWVLLAGYLVFPGTFTSLRSSTSFRQTAAKSEVGIAAYNTVQNIPLLGVAAVCCTVGMCGAGWLWYRWWYNCVWLARKLFLPILINSATGFINTLINVYTAHTGSWSVTAIVTVTVTGSLTLISGVLYLIHNSWLFMRLERAFDAKTDMMYRMAVVEA